MKAAIPARLRPHPHHTRQLWNLPIVLSLLVGFVVRIRSVAGVILLMLYWTAHMEWPKIEKYNNLIVDYHI